MNCRVEAIRGLWLSLCMLSSSFFLAIQHIFLLPSTIHRAQKENKHCRHWEPSAVAKLQGLIFEEELLREEACFKVSLKQLLKSIFPKVGICARLRYPKSRCCSPNPSCAQGSHGAGIWSLNLLPHMLHTSCCFSHTAQGVQNAGDSRGYSSEQKCKAWVFIRRKGWRQEKGSVLFKEMLWVQTGVELGLGNTHLCLSARGMQRVFSCCAYSLFCLTAQCCWVFRLA